MEDGSPARKEKMFFVSELLRCLIIRRRRRAVHQIVEVPELTLRLATIFFTSSSNLRGGDEMILIQGVARMRFFGGFCSGCVFPEAAC